MLDNIQDFDSNKLCVFLADDDIDDRIQFSKAFSEIGENMDVHLFRNGEELLHALHSSIKLPTMIFLDLIMPNMDGAECLSKIRSEKKFDCVAVVLYSNVIYMQRIEELFRLGANRYLRKTSSLSSLVRSLRRTVESIVKNPTGGMAVINFTER